MEWLLQWITSCRESMMDFFWLPSTNCAQDQQLYYTAAFPPPYNKGPTVIDWSTSYSACVKSQFYHCCRRDKFASCRSVFSLFWLHRHLIHKEKVRFEIVKSQFSRFLQLQCRWGPHSQKSCCVYVPTSWRVTGPCPCSSHPLPWSPVLCLRAFLWNTVCNSFAVEKQNQE